MNKILKESTVLVSILLFLISAMSSAYSISTVQNAEISNKNLQKTMIIYRVSHDGSTTPIEIDVEENIEDINKYLESKCSELFEEDIEMQTLVQNLQKKDCKDKNLQENVGLYNIYSKGKGFHIKTKLGLNFFKSQFMLLRAILATFLISPKKGLVIGIYNDEEAFTTFKPIGKNVSATNITGKHALIVGGFFGYTTWTGRFSHLHGLFEISRLRFPRVFRGICTLVFYKQLE